MARAIKAGKPLTEKPKKVTVKKGVRATKVKRKTTTAAAKKVGY